MGPAVRNRSRGDRSDEPGRTEAAVSTLSVWLWDSFILITITVRTIPQVGLLVKPSERNRWNGCSLPQQERAPEEDTNVHGARPVVEEVRLGSGPSCSSA